MSTGSKAEMRYQPAYCAVLHKHVWAILTRQPDGTWRVANCLDKDEACFNLDCAFTTSGGPWPYTSPPSRPAPVSDAAPQ